MQLLRAPDEGVPALEQLARDKLPFARSAVFGANRFGQFEQQVGDIRGVGDHA
jgi:hypothetical protein